MVSKPSQARWRSNAVDLLKFALPIRCSHITMDPSYNKVLRFFFYQYCVHDIHQPAIQRTCSHGCTILAIAIVTGPKLQFVHSLKANQVTTVLPPIHRDFNDRYIVVL